MGHFSSSMAIVIHIAILNEFLFTKIEEEDIDNIWFQQDGATCHRTVIVKIVLYILGAGELFLWAKVLVFFLFLNSLLNHFNKLEQMTLL